MLKCEKRQFDIVERHSTQMIWQTASNENRSLFEFISRGDFLSFFDTNSVGSVERAREKKQNVTNAKSLVQGV